MGKIFWTVSNFAVKGTSHDPPELRELFICKENTGGLLIMRFTERNNRYFEEK